MQSYRAPTSKIARALTILERAAEPLVAIELADRLGLEGMRETRRRRVRAIIKRLRDDGVKIVATLGGGYWLTEDESIWRDYIEHRVIDAKRILGESHRRKKASSENNQGLLFDNLDLPVGYN